MSAPASSTPSMRKRHVFMLQVASLVVLLSVLLRVPSPDRVELPFWPGLKLPGMCMSRAWFGVKCPACGLTRSLICLAHGNFLGSWQAHRLGWLMAAAVLLQFPYRIAALVQKRDYPLGETLPRLFGLGLIFLLIGNWVLGLLP